MKSTLIASYCHPTFRTLKIMNAKRKLGIQVCVLKIKLTRFSIMCIFLLDIMGCKLHKSKNKTPHLNGLKNGGTFMVSVLYVYTHSLFDYYNFLDLQNHGHINQEFYTKGFWISAISPIITCLQHSTPMDHFIGLLHEIFSSEYSGKYEWLLFT